MTRKFVITPDGEGFVDFTPEEEAQLIKDREAEVIRREAETAKQAKLASGKQKLKDLGLDDDELKQILGI
tara:strand:- start:208 stop:417 length:210 start_codon:yes stop_codon:yes gene_type:complete